MRMLALVLAHLRRHQRRTLFGVLVLGFSVALMLAILATIRGTAGMVERVLAVDGHHLVLENKAENVLFGSVTSAQLAGLRALPQVQSAHPVLFGMVSTPGHPLIACFGLEPGDPRLARAKWIAGSATDFGRRKNGVWLGAQAAKFLDVALSEPVEIGRGQFIVAGIFEAENGLENGGVFLSLSAAQDFFRRDGVVSTVAVRLRNPAQGAAFEQAITELFPGLAAVEGGGFAQGEMSRRLQTAAGWAAGFLAFILGGLGVALTMVRSAQGHRRDFALLRVCGFSKRQIAGLMVGEASVIALAGLVLGFALGQGALAGLAMFPPFHGYIRAELSPSILSGTMITGLVATVAGAILPTYFAARAEPVEALRDE